MRQLPSTAEEAAGVARGRGYRLSLTSSLTYTHTPGHLDVSAKSEFWLGGAA